MSAPVSPDRPTSPDSTRFVVPDQAAPSRYPQHFGPYLLLSRLARGGMGDVCLAKVGRVAGIERLCVVKSIRSNLIGDDEYVRRFVDEARTVVQLAHRNICPVLDVGAVDAQYYLAMELIAGRDLRTIQERAREKQGALPQQLVLHIVGEVLEALDYAHRMVDARTGEPLGIVHRDVSPQNVMVSFEGEVKLIDFGLATSAQKLERTEPGVVLGKLQYMSPEQARGDRIDQRTDIFATGVLLYELLVGERYYEGLSIDNVWQRVGSGAHAGSKLATLPARLREIVERSVAANPAARFPSCGELRNELHEYQVRRQQISSPTELRALMTTLFPGEEADDRRARAVLAATPMPSAPREVTRSVRFAAPAEPVAADITVANQRSPSVTTEGEQEPTRSGEEPTGAVRALPLSLPARPPRRRLALAVGLAATAVGVALAVVQPWVAAEDLAVSPPTPIEGLANAMPVAPAAAAVTEPTPAPTPTPTPVAAAEDPPEPSIIEPLDVAATTRIEKRTRRRAPTPPAPRTSTPAASLPEVPSTATGRVKFLAEHCRAAACAAPLLADHERWKQMTEPETRAHVAAVKECAQRCHDTAR